MIHFRLLLDGLIESTGHDAFTSNAYGPRRPDAVSENHAIAHARRDCVEQSEAKLL
jgi:hypothetical protein